jgi:dihydrodipicolinate synthase/N-acetylneuraminate lyase
MAPLLDEGTTETLRRGMVIPAHPLALTAERRLDERRQRALGRYYLAAGAGGLAVAVHTTQFAIREPGIDLFRPVLELAMDVAREPPERRPLMVAGVIGGTDQAIREAALARDLGYDVALLQLGSLRDASDAELVAHCRRVAEVVPIFGFYLQPAVGGRPLGYAFWREFAQIDGVVAIKVAPFDRYATLDVVRAVRDSGRSAEVALYTGNDDSIILDLVTPYGEDAAPHATDMPAEPMRFVGGLLGHWACWTSRAVEHLDWIHRVVQEGRGVPDEMLSLATKVTDANSAFFDVANRFVGSIAGIHEVLRRQGLLEGRWCLDPDEDLSPGQAAEIDRVHAAYPELNDDAFVAEHLDEWLA